MIVAKKRDGLFQTFCSRKRKMKTSLLFVVSAMMLVVSVVVADFEVDSKTQTLWSECVCVCVCVCVLSLIHI